ncbi:hypothetical protein [Methanoculleus frigidifontis]|uniref:hypothetical protein n=1 Tax=Methanoculleus frigidifontis TaxID=2584085 RepID=UPI00265B4069|nr:hypothetical protein [Methanoculleus sp. FWC-SCC1]
MIEKAAAERYGYLPFGTDRGVSLLIFSITGAKTLDAAGEGLERLKEMLARIG